MKRIQGRSLKGQMQKGFTLVELAIVLVIAGIILVGVLKGTDAVNKAKVERMVADLKGLQGTILEYQKRNNRLPGDCNNDGLIGYTFTGNIVNKLYGNPTAGVTTPDNTVAFRQLLPNPAVAGVRATCTTTVTNEDNINLMWNELRRAGVVDDQRLPFELARHVMDDGYLVGGLQDATNNSTNIIVAYGIPVWMAEAIDAEIDGVAQVYGDNNATGPANSGRVRLVQSSVSAGISAGAASGVAQTIPAGSSGQYGNQALSRDDLVSISFQFDTRKLPN
jgi:prepilin-type N-terminal cleavage/methylation domain-containing protein